MTNVNNIFVKKIYFMLVAVVSLFSYSGEPLNSFDGKMLICEKDYMKNNFFNNKLKEYENIPTSFIGFRFIENKVSVDKILTSPPEIKKTIEDINWVSEYEASWCDGTEMVTYQNKPHLHPPTTLSRGPYFQDKNTMKVDPNAPKIVEKEFKECINEFTLARDTGNVKKDLVNKTGGYLTNDTFQRVIGRNIPFTIHYRCKLYKDVNTYENFLKYQKIREENRLKDIETEKLKKLKERKL